MADVRIQILGPASAWRGGELLGLGPAGQRATLGLLALACGRAVSRDELASGLWPDRPPPPSAANVIQTYVKRLRRLLEPERPPRTPGTLLCAVGDGYALRLPTDAVDIQQFRYELAAAATAQRNGQLDRAADLLGTALSRWHGPPLADLPALRAHPKVAALADERQAALARYGEVMLHSGRPADGVAALEEAAAAQPLNEAWQAQLIRAYQATGQRSRAFASYHDTRRRLADDLGVDPGPELSEAHAVLLRADSVPTVPAQLPTATRAFAGRVRELALLDDLLRGPRTPGVVVVSGAPGVGKTALAVRWAHRIAPRFTDGQLYVSLRGFDPGGAATEPGDAIRSLLAALGVPTERVPATTDGRVSLYRSLLVGRRMLIVLDNARDVAQVRPLLPGEPGCLVLVTARHHLVGLIAAEGAHPFPLAPLRPDDARDLLARRVGPARIAAEPAALAEIITRCAGLPLALVIIAARAALHEHLPLAVLADELRRSGDRLDTLATGDPETDPRAVFSWSYHALTASAARLFRLLGLHAGPDISAPAAASLAALTAARARTLLAELVRAGLATEHTTGRYAMHDLLRVYAAECAARFEPTRARRAATVRMLDHYLHSAAAADLRAQLSEDPFAPPPPASGAVPEPADDAAAAMEWLAAERAVLVAAVERAASASPRHAWQLARSVAKYLDVRGHWDDLASTQLTAVAAARHDRDPRAEAHAHRLLARAYTRLRRVDDADRELLHALELYRAAGDRIGQGHTRLSLSLLRERQGRHREALDHAALSLVSFQDAGDEHGIARALNAVGWYCALTGDHAAALRHCRRALALLSGFGDRSGQASTLDSIGYAHHHLGRRPQAVAAFRQALSLYRDLGDRHLEAFVLIHLGDSHAAGGYAAAARAAWGQALDTLARLDPLEAERVRTRLAGAPGGAARPVSGAPPPEK
ncbi:DNA-binding SARP family transcriptional activator/Tfp pilus assembly protein PilF [Allocatelliglobosispora scoriae]|uniref:DNA-binding SARP family transcriptional activator/Tfp pilus assembly protein PilF n=1 Tax=Allocatelliglobosispora scoriae TaxID=643052 RepID=A0A841BHT6_9ACTN|nr:BTAD domain-containing putative transcriptional regulator [Allocatelliglobosispora scoriae]MBB5867844.1 DNA-binding SARP family transcriptional activator/Tfp pilus assembly protein PilF [Allocatelliglobosispora scoriae]